MKGLLLKDCYILQRQMKWFVVLIFVFALLPNAYLQLFAIVYGALVPYTTIAHDEQSHWDQLAGMMPYPVRSLVLSKYVLGWCVSGVVTLLATAACVVGRRFSEDYAQPEVVAVAFSLALLTIAFSLPFLFRFGVARGRMVMLLVIAIICGSAGVLSGAFGKLGPVTELTGIYLIPLAAVMITIISVPVSMAMYRRKYN